MLEVVSERIGLGPKLLAPQRLFIERRNETTQVGRLEDREQFLVSLVPGGDRQT